MSFFCHEKKKKKKVFAVMKIGCIFAIPKHTDMKNITIATEKELKALVASNRASIANINGVQFGTMYPLINCSNKHASYYDVATQGNKFLHAPFNVTLR